MQLIANYRVKRGVFLSVFLAFFTHVGNVYWVVFWFKLSLDLIGVAVAGADGSPLKHLLLQMCSRFKCEIDFYFVLLVVGFFFPLHMCYPGHSQY